MTRGSGNDGSLKPSQTSSGFSYKQRDDLARLGGQAALAGGQQIEVRQHDDAAFDGPAHGLAELGDHGADHADRHGGLLLVLLARPAVEVEAAQVRRP